MLEQRDLEAIRGIMKEELTESENLILGEVDRVQENLEKRFETVEKNLEELKQYYRIEKLEGDNMTLFFQMLRELTKRVEELERRSA